MLLFKNKYDEIRSGWVLLLAGIVLFIALTLVALTTSLITGDGANLFNQPFVDYPLMTVCLLLLFWAIYKRPLNQMGFYANGWVKQLAAGGLFGIILTTSIFVIALLSGFVQITAVNLGYFTYSLLWVGLLLYIGVGFFEETFARGFVMTVLKTTRNKWVVVILSSLIFGLLHIAAPNITPLSLANITLIGILLVYLFIKTGRLWASIGFHITWNFAFGNIFGTFTNYIAPISIIQTETMGLEWLTGGHFGLGGGAIGTIVVLLGLLYVHFGIEHNKNFWQISSDLPL
ncbi:MAG: CPBP family intramembrane metalloprotease [Defluviitaleaceae bacterium]|nr:CPBP family intramembrane metalloprotease [Defluviitaleaceae bacterium]